MIIASNANQIFQDFLTKFFIANKKLIKVTNECVIKGTNVDILNFMRDRIIDKE